MTMEKNDKALVRTFTVSLKFKKPKAVACDKDFVRSMH